MELLDPVLVCDLFPLERRALLQLLRELDEQAWHIPTVCAGWSVKDIAQHLLADDLGILSRKRDSFDYLSVVKTPYNLDSWDELVAFINEMNAIWVQATRRLSGQVLCSLLEFSGEELYRYFSSLDPYAIGDPVSWAGPAPAPVWLDIAREYTERWMHQQHIRDAVGKPALKERKFFAPVLETFIRALPHTYRDVQASDGTCIRLMITGEAGGDWTLLHDKGQWILGKTTAFEAHASVTLDQETAWRLFTKGMSKEDALLLASISGDYSLGVIVLNTVSIIA
jgi:uncharacterized protein (TIGR03083 family)